MLEKLEIKMALDCLKEAHNHLRKAYFASKEQDTRYYCSTGMRKIITIIKHLH